MANLGKNKLLRYLRLFLGGYDLSGDSRSFDSLDNQFAEIDTTGWNESIRTFLADQIRIVGLRGYSAFLNDTTSSGSFPNLNAPNTVLPGVLTLCQGGNAEFEAGDPAYLMRSVQLVGQAAMENGIATINGDFLPLSGYTDGNPWGVVLSPKTSIAITTTNTTVINYVGAVATATTNGFLANLHITASASGNFSMKIEHSANGSTWATLGTFSTTGGSVTSESMTGTGTVNAYLRFVATRTGGTITPVCAITRL